MNNKIKEKENQPNGKIKILKIYDFQKEKKHAVCQYS